MSNSTHLKKWKVIWMKYKENFPLNVSSIGRYFLAGGFLIIYLWFTIFGKINLWVILLNLVLGLCTVFSDIIVYQKLKFNYLDAFYFEKSMVSFSLFYLFKLLFSSFGWLKNKQHSLLWGQNLSVVGNSEIFPILFPSIKTIGDVFTAIFGILALLLSIHSTILFARTGYHTIIPAWNSKVNIGETLFIAYVGGGIVYDGLIALLSNEDLSSLSILSLNFSIFIASFLVIPLYFFKQRYFSIESPETRDLLNILSKYKPLIYFSFILLLIGSFSLILMCYLNKFWSVFSVVFGLISIVLNRFIFFGTMIKDYGEEKIDIVSAELFGFP